MVSRYYRAVCYGICCCIAALLFITGPCFAQSDLESLRKYWYYPGSRLQPDTTEIKKILQIADALSSRRPDSAQVLARQALHTSNKLGFLLGIAHAYNTLGACCYQQDKYDSAIFFFQKALIYARQLKYNPGLFRIHDNLAQSYFHKGSYEASLDHYDLSLRVMESDSVHFPVKRFIAVYCNMGLIWLRLNAGDQALRAFNKAKQLAEQSGDSLMRAPIMARLGVALSLKQKSKEAESHYLQALAIARDYNQLHYQVEIANSLAHLYIDQARLEAAKAQTIEVLRLLEQHPQLSSRYAKNHDDLHARHNLGLIYLQQGDLEKARPLLLKAFSAAKTSGSRDLVAHMEPDISALYAATGNYKKAYDHMLHYAVFRDTLLEQQKGKMLSTWIESRMNEKDKELMAQELRISRQRSQLQAKNFWIGGTVTGSLLLLSAFLAFARSYHNKQKLQQSALLRLQQEQEINQLKAQVRGEEQERNRIALELHDGIASQLWAIKLNVDSLQQQYGPGAAPQQSLRSIYQQLDDTTQEVRKTAHNLMPDLLLEEGLATALASFCDKIKKQTDLEVDFLEYGTIPRMDEEIELSLYRMIQELIQNVLKHAEGATQLLVQLSCIDTLLNITVEDNGAGFPGDNAGAAKGIGLRHIEKRVKALQGHIDLQSIAGKGTTVYLEFDIQHLL